MKKAIAYVRYSSAIQSKGDSIDRQMSPLEAFENRFNLKIDEIYTDEGVSSYSGDNIKKGRFADILEKIESGEISAGSYLIIESIDRISRQELNKTAKILQDILTKGIKIYTTINEKLYNYEDKERDLENYLMIGLEAKRANEESEIKSKRRKSAWNKAKRLAEEEGKIFSTSQNTPYGLRIENGKFEIIEEEAKEIRFIIKNLQHEGVSATIRKLNEWSKRKWQAKHVGHFMKNQYIRGIYRAQKRVEGKKVHERYIENYYPAIVSDTAFYQAKEAMSRRTTKKEFGNKAKGHLNMFKNCIKCQECGSTMIFMKNKNPKGVWYSYYACESRKEKKIGCEDQFLRAEYVIALFLDEMRYIFNYNNSLNGDELTETQKDVIKLITQKKDKIDNLIIREKETELYKTKAQLEHLEEEAEKLEKIPTYMFRKMSILEEELENIKIEIAKLDASRKESASFADFSEFLEKIYTEAGRIEINNFLKSLDIKIYVSYLKKYRFLQLKAKQNETVFIDNSKSFRLRNDELLVDFDVRNITDYI